MASSSTTGSMSNVVASFVKRTPELFDDFDSALLPGSASAMLTSAVSMRRNYNPHQGTPLRVLGPRPRAGFSPRPVLSGDTWSIYLFPPDFQKHRSKTPGETRDTHADTRTRLTQTNHITKPTHRRTNARARSVTPKSRQRDPNCTTHETTSSFPRRDPGANKQC